MGKLKELVKEETSLTNRIKYNTRRVRLASIGLISKVDAERVRLYKQLMEAGQGAGDESTLLGVINTLSAGAAKLVREETQRIFEDLVQTGEKVAAVPTAEAVISKAKKSSKSVIGAPVQASLVNDAAKALLSDSLQKAKAALAKIDKDLEESVQLEALYLQASEGDVKGRRPAATKESERALFDARKDLKGLSPEESMEKFFSLAKKLKNAVSA